MKKHYVYLGVVATVLAVIGCPLASNTPNTPNTPTTGMHMYIAGGVNYSTGGSGVGPSQAVYWKDGTINYLPLNFGYSWGWADYIAQDKSGNIYVLGQQGGSGTGPQLWGYWRNGAFTTLADFNTYPFINELGLAVDTNGNVWALAFAGSDNNHAVPYYWKNSGSPTQPPNATNLTGIAADASGNVYMTGMTGGTAYLASTGFSSNWTPTVWKNGITATPLSTTLSGTGYSYGFVSSPVIDASGNLYACGSVFTAGGVPVYWKAAAGNLASNSATSFSVAGYPVSTYTYWVVYGTAVDNSGNVDAQANVSTTGAPPLANGFYSNTSSPPASLIYWRGGAPGALPLGTDTSWFSFWGATDSSGNYFVTGAIATDAGAAATNGQGIPVYWKNGGTAVQLPMGTNGGTPNTFGKAQGIMFGQ